MPGSMSSPESSFNHDPSFGMDKGQAPRHYEMINNTGKGESSRLPGSQDFKEASPPGGSNPEDEAKHKLESQIGATFLARESIYENWATKGKDPGIMVEGLRQLYTIEDDSNVNEEVRDPWRLKRVHSEIYDRGLRMKMSVEELDNRKWIAHYNPETGLADVIDRNAVAFAISVEEKPDWRVTEKETIKVNDQIQTVERQTLQINYEYNFGRKYKDESGRERDERKEMARICERLCLEMSVKGVEGSIFGAINAYRDNVESLSEILQRFKFTVPHLETLYNAPDKDLVKENVEDYTEGLRTETATWWFLAMMASEKKSTMEDFIKRPATENLIMPGASNEDRTRFLKTMLGDWDEWKDEWEEKGVKKVRTKDTLLQENKDGKRGPISKWGNIPARGQGENKDFSYGEEMNFIKLIGELAGSESAAWSAASHLHAFQEFAMNGVVRFVDGSVCLELGTAIFLKGNDLGKNNVDEFITKERKKGRPSGPRDIIGKMPKLGLSYLDHAQIIVRLGGDGKPITVPLRVAWLGDYERKVINKSTGNEVILQAEPYNRLGSINYKTMARDDFGSNKLLVWLADREKNGLLGAALNGEPAPEVFGEKALKGFKKYFGIIFNGLTANNGDMREQTEISKTADRIASQAVSDLLDAYENTSSYRIGMRKNVPMFDPQRSDPGRTGKTERGVSLSAIYKGLRAKLGFSTETFNANDQFMSSTEVEKITELNLKNTK